VTAVRSNQPGPFALVGDYERDRRREICRACSLRAGRLLTLSVCKACGCPILSKTKLARSECPKGKW
jgi:hypothetical protein